MPETGLPRQSIKESLPIRKINLVILSTLPPSITMIELHPQLHTTSLDNLKYKEFTSLFPLKLVNLKLK